MNIIRNSNVFVHIFGIFDLLFIRFAESLFKLLTLVLIVLSSEIEEGC